MNYIENKNKEIYLKLNLKQSGMKKFYFFNLLFLVALSIQAQDIVLFEQPNAGTGNGIVSDVQSNGTLLGAWSVEDFVITDGGTVNSVTVEGFSNDLVNFNAGLQSVEFYIFADNAGIPAGTPTNPNSWELFLDLAPDDAALDIDDTTNVNITVDLVEATGSGFVASPGVTYWISVAPKVNFDFTSETGGSQRWNWFSGDAFGNEAQLTFRNGAFGQPDGTYTSLTALGLSFGHLNLLLEGTTSLSNNEFAKDAFSIYPNPAKDNLNIVTKNNEAIQEIKITNAQGRQLDVRVNNNNQVDVSQLASGFYFIYVETESGKNAIKFIKS